MPRKGWTQGKKGGAPRAARGAQEKGADATARGAQSAGATNTACVVCSCSPPAQGPRGPWAGRQRGQESGEGAGAAALQRGQEREKRYHVDRENKTNTRFRGGAGGEAAFCDSTASRWMRKTQHESRKEAGKSPRSAATTGTAPLISCSAAFSWGDTLRLYCLVGKGGRGGTQRRAFLLEVGGQTPQTARGGW